MKQTHITESELIARLKRKDKSVIADIYRQYAATLLGVIDKIVRDQATAEDVLQDSLVKIWRRSDGYDPAKGRLFTWMLNICRNSAIDKIRSKGFRQQMRIQGGTDSVSLQENSPSYSFNPDQIGVREWVSKLSAEYAEVIEIVYFSGYTHVEAAEKLNLPLGTLKTRLRAAIKKLKTMV